MCQGFIVHFPIWFPALGLMFSSKLRAQAVDLQENQSRKSEVRMCRRLIFRPFWALTETGQRQLNSSESEGHSLFITKLLKNIFLRPGLTMQTRLSLNSQISCLLLPPEYGIKGMHYIPGNQYIYIFRNFSEVEFKYHKSHLLFPGMVAHAYDLSTQETETDHEFKAWATQ